MKEPHTIKRDDGHWTCRCGAEAPTYDDLEHAFTCPARPRLGPNPCEAYNARMPLLLELAGAIGDAIILQHLAGEKTE